MTDTKKIRKTAFVMSIAVSLTLLWVAIRSAWGIFSQGNLTEWNAASVITTVIGVLIIFPALIISLSLLHSAKSDVSPFNIKNVKKLKMIAVLLVMFEPYFYVSEWVCNKYYAIVIEGMTLETHSSVLGIVFSAGLVVYCVSLIFEYGISLQQQVDETL